MAAGCSLWLLAAAALAFSAYLDADGGTLVLMSALVAVAGLKLAAVATRRGAPAVLAWPKALAFGAVLLAGCAAAWLSPCLYRTSGPALAAAVVFSAGLIFGLAGADPAGADPAVRRFDLLACGLLCAALFYGLVLAARAWVLSTFNDPTFTLVLFYVGRGGYEGIPSGPFQWDARLAYAALWWAATLLCAAWAWRFPSLKRVLALAGTGLAGKFALAGLSGSGLQVLPQKITAISTAYYSLALTIPRPQGLGLWEFIRRFNQLQAGTGIHGASHPFGPELFYWLLQRCGGGPWTCACAVAALTALTPVLLHQLALELGFEPRAGLAVALVYLACPAAGVLSTSGIDSVVTLSFAATAVCAARAARRGTWAPALLGGLCAFGASLLTPAVAYLALMLAFGAALAWPRLPRGSRAGLAKAAALLALVPLALHLLLWAATGFQFHYAQVVRDAAPWSFFAGARPPRLWSWLNPLLYLGYAGAGTLTLAAAAALAWLQEGRRPALAALVPAAVLLQVWLQGLAFGECERVFHWGYAGLSLLALAPAFLRWGKDRGFATLAGLATLNALTSIVLMMTVMDYW